MPVGEGRSVSPRGRPTRLLYHEASGLNAEPEWVEEFLFHVRRTARDGRVNVKLCCQLASVYREKPYYSRRLPGYERLRAEWAMAVQRARQVRERRERVSHSAQ